MFIDNKGDSMVAAQELKAIADAESSPPSSPSSYFSCGLESDLADVHLQDDSDHSLFSIYTSAAPGLQNGKGAFANRDIRRGDLILSEKPIFSIPNNVPQPVKHTSTEDAVRNLSPTHLDNYLSLHNSHAECSCSLRPLRGIFTTNSFRVSDSGEPAGGICLKASRFNHSCSPNARFTFNSNTGDIRIYALGTIPRGREIFIAYTPEDLLGRRLYGSPRQLRQATLRNQYHFTCECSICSLSEAESKVSDARRQRIYEIWESLGSYSLSQGAQCLNVIVEAIHLLKEEGNLSDTDGFTDKAGFFSAFHSDWVSTRYWVDLTYHSRVAEYGEDSAHAADVRKEYLDPKSYILAGMGPAKDLTRFRV